MKTVIISCRSVKLQLETVLGENNLPEIIYLPPILHIHPEKLRTALEGLLAALKGIFTNVVVVYGKCAPNIDEILAKYDAVRLPGEFCYEMLAGVKRFREILNEEPGTYFLTDDLCRNFNTLVVEPLGWDVQPKLKESMLRHYKRVVYLDAVGNGILDTKARDIADYLKLHLEIERTGTDNFGQLVFQTLQRFAES